MGSGLRRAVGGEPARSKSTARKEGKDVKQRWRGRDASTPAFCFSFFFLFSFASANVRKVSVSWNGENSEEEATGAFIDEMGRDTRDKSK